MRKPLAALVLASGLVLTPAVAHAQTTQPAPSTTIVVQRVEDDDDDGNGGLWGLAGLAGLLGLIGLAGLRRRPDRTYTSGTVSGDTTPRGSSRG